MSEISDQLRELGRSRRLTGQMLLAQRELTRIRRREQRKRQAKQILDGVSYTAGVLAIAVAVVIVLLSL